MRPCSPPRPGSRSQSGGSAESCHARGPTNVVPDEAPCLRDNRIAAPSPHPYAPAPLNVLWSFEAFRPDLVLVSSWYLNLQLLRRKPQSPIPTPWSARRQHKVFRAHLPPRPSLSTFPRCPSTPTSPRFSRPMTTALVTSCSNFFEFRA